MNFFFFAVFLAFSTMFLMIGAAPMSQVAEKPSDDLETFLGGHFANVDVDGVETLAPKKTEKLPGQKKMKAEFQQPEGITPEFTGSFGTFEDIGVEAAQPSTQGTDEAPETSEDSDADYFELPSAPVANPALTYLAGASFDKLAQPSCQMLGCTGPIPNDGSYAAMSASLDGKACSQTFVPLNGCTDNKGYPMGMLCSVCCDCANSFVMEMKKTFGYKAGVDTSVFSS